jgi:hypothetical protein
MENNEIINSEVAKDVAESGISCAETAALVGVGAVAGTIIWNRVIKPLWHKGKQAVIDMRAKKRLPAAVDAKPKEGSKED